LSSSAISSFGLDRTRAAKLIKEKGLDGVFFTSPENVFYTTGAHTLPGTGNPILFALSNSLPAFSYVDSDGKVTLFVWMGAAMGIEYVGEEVRTFIDRAGAAEELSSFLKERLSRGSSVGVESTCPFWALTLVEGLAGRDKVIQADQVAFELRLVKSAKELDLIWESAQIVEAAVSDLSGRLRVGMSRLELAQDARRILIERGATAVDHLTIAFGPSNPEVLLDETLRQGQLVTLDLGAVYEGYVSDNRRLFYAGESVPEATRKLHGALVNIVDAVGAALIPGAPFSDVYSLAVSLFEREGLQPMFFHVGHSIGLQTEEAWITAESALTVEENMVLNIELYAPDESGVMIGDEETFVVGSGGGWRVTVSPREIQAIRPSNP
jgi:Xaa-Pro aminopeptidase